MPVSPVVVSYNPAVALLVALPLAGLGACGPRGGGTGADAEAPPVGCVGTCTPDPGSRPVNCAEQEAGLEFFKFWDFETGFGRFMYEYTDRSSPNISPMGYQAPEAQTTNRCGPPTQVMRIHGGPFRGWGGGVGIGFAHLHDSPAACPDPGCPQATPDFPQAVATIDVSRWQGISFWARRGPNSQAAVRLGLGDRYTDDDVSYLMYRADPLKPRACERNRECGCVDQGKSCSYFEGAGAGDTRVPAGYYCWNPGTDNPPAPARGEFGDMFSYATCSTTKCDEPYAAHPEDQSDPAFQGRGCRPYSFGNGTAAMYCFDPGADPNPFDGNQTCGDSWVSPVTLTTDWRLYLVPFTRMAQQGFGKKFPKLDLTAATMLRLMWDVGWVDYWVDDVGFYRLRD
jgi:hypothetical protein